MGKWGFAKLSPFGDFERQCVDVQRVVMGIFGDGSPCKAAGWRVAMSKIGLAKASVPFWRELSQYSAGREKINVQVNDLGSANEVRPLACRGGAASFMWRTTTDEAKGRPWRNVGYLHSLVLTSILSGRFTERINSLAFKKSALPAGVIERLSENKRNKTLRLH